MSGYLSSRGIPAARKRFADLSARLRAAASGAVVVRATAAIAAQVEAVAKRITSEHRASGAAADGLVLTTSSGTVSLTSNRYLGLHGWWIFRSGMPPFVITRANKIYARELEAAIAGEPSPLLTADASAEAAASAKRAKREARARKRSEAFEARVAKSRAKTERLYARHAAKLEKIRTRGAERSARHEARMAKFREHQAKRAARSEAQLNRGRERYKKANAKIARSQARAAKRGSK